MKIMQKILSLMLVLAMLCSFLPGAAVRVRATEVDVQESTAPVETTVETEPVVEAQPEAETVPEEIQQETVPPETEAAEETAETVDLEVLETMPQLEAEGEAGDEGSCGDAMTWTLDSKGTLTISGSGEMTSTPWLDEYADVIKKVIIEEGISNIYQEAFENCSSLSNATLPSSLTKIGSYAFYDCGELTKIVLPEKLVTLENYAFAYAGITEVNIPTTLTTMGSSSWKAFTSCPIENLYIEDLEHLLSFSHDGGLRFSNLYINGELVTDLVIPDTITSLYNYAFDYVTCLESITIPESVTYIGTYAFHGCENLKEVNWPGSVGTVQSYTFQECDSLTSLTLPAGVVTINSNAFADAYSNYPSALTELRILGNAPLIAEDGFTGVTATVYYSADNTSWTEDVFQNYGGTITWVADNTIPGTGTEEDLYIVEEGTCGDTMTWTLDSKGTLTISGSGEMTSTPWQSEYTDVIKKVIIEEGISNIYQEAFENCSSLSNATLPSSLTKIGSYAFYDCGELTKIVLPEKLVTLENYAFAYAGITEVNIPTTLTTMGSSSWKAFTSCPIENLYIEDLEHLLSFSHDGGLRFSNLYINGELVTDLVIPDTITSLYNYAFDYVTCLESITIPESVTYIGTYAFHGCENLKEVNWPGSVGTVQSYIFQECDSLTSLTLPAGVVTINSNAFADAYSNYPSALTELRILGNAPLIAEDGFTGVTATVYYSANNTSWTEDVFQNYGGTITWVADDTIPGTGEEEEVYIIASGTCGENVYWSLDSNGQLLVYGSANTRAVESYDMADYASPEETPWFEYQSQIKTVTVESTVNSIGDNAFAECENLESVTIEEGVAEVGESAFSKCENLEEVTFEGSAPELGENCFEEVEATVNYPEDDETWTEDTLEGTGGTIELNPVHIHAHTAVVTDPTCTEGGYTTYTCECGDSYIADEVEPTGHIWDEGTITQEPTAEQPGIMTYECTVCEETMTEEIPYEAPEEEPTAVQRIAGADRIETALAVATELKDVLGVEKFDSIILAAGGSGSDQTKFADALSGSYLASAKKAPILLYTTGNLSSKNLTFIEENLSENGTIYLLGGNVSIPAEVEDSLNASGYTTKRLGGADRYQTNLIILEEAGIDSADEILIAGGQAFADSLSASATGLPIMLVNGTKTTLTTAQIEFLQSLNGKKVTILGGTAAVSADLEAAIEEAVGGTADRIYGDARENTSAMIAEKYFADADMALIAYSRMYPDGLAGGVLANALHAPLLLTKAGSESIANAYIEEYGIEAGYALGGTAVMSDETVRAVFGLAEDAVITLK